MCMRKTFAFFSIVLLLSCGDKETDLSSDVPLKPNEFVAAFRLLDNGFAANDKEIVAMADSVNINARHLKKFIPDSIINNFLEGDKKASFRALGRIHKNDETYLLLVSIKNKLPSLFVVVLDLKNNYLASKKLYTVLKNDTYTYNLNVNREPTFFVSRETTVNEKELKYTKLGWAYNNKNFIVVVKESNERSEKITNLVNPIDTFKRDNLYSGNYAEDDRNFIAIRDGRTKQEYLFFLHTEKNDGACNGELKGEMKLTDSTHAIYMIGGDPCVIDFTFGRNSIVIKEKGSCGNRRGMDCFFDDTYAKKKEPKKKIEKSKLVKVPKTNVAQLLLQPKPKKSTKKILPLKP